MVDLGARLDVGILDLAEIADLGLRRKPRARPQPREGADLGAGGDAGALQMREGADARARGDADARPEHDVGLDQHVRLDLGVMGERHRRRRDHGNAPDHQRAAAALLPDRFGLGKLQPVVDAEQVLEGRLDGHHLEAAPIGDLDDIGQVELALGVVVADRIEQAERIGARERHQAAIAEIDAALLGAAVAILADRGKRPVAHDQPAVACRRIGPEAGNHDICAGAELGPQPRQVVRLQQGRIAESDDDIVMALLDRLARGEHRMGGAEPFGLQEGPGGRRETRHRLADAFRLAPNDDGDVACRAARRRLDDMRDHRQAGDRMQDFRHRALHSRALAGGEDDGQTGSG